MGGCQKLTARVSQICSTVRALPTVTSRSPASSSLPNPSLLPPSPRGCEQVSSSPRTHLGLSKCSPRKWVPELSLSILRSFVFRSTLQKGRPSGMRLGVQQLGLSAFTAGNKGSILGRVTKIVQTTQLGKKKKKGRTSSFAPVLAEKVWRTRSSSSKYHPTPSTHTCVISFVLLVSVIAHLS